MCINAKTAFPPIIHLELIVNRAPTRQGELHHTIKNNNILH